MFQRGSHALLYLRTMHCRVTTPQPLRSPMLLPLLPKGAIGGVGGPRVMASEMQRGTIGAEGGGVYRYRGCLASRVTLEIPLSSFYVRHRETLLGITLSYSYHVDGFCYSFRMRMCSRNDY